MTTKNISIITASLVLVVGINAYAEEGEATLDKVKVTASGQLLDDVAQPVRILDQDALQAKNGNTLGELLSDLPGISNASFGAGVGRPVIRGLGGNRVKMAINGTDSADVSAMSSDHAPMVDAANAQSVEVIYGPNTLRYGSGAMGGVVNMADSRFHEYSINGWQGRVQSSVSSANDGTNLSGSTDIGHGQWVMHLDAFSRSSDNFRAGDGTTINNTDSESQGMNAGLNYIQQNGNAYGAAVSALDYNYGVPNPDDDRATVDPSQLRFDAQAIVYSLASVDKLKMQFTHIDYEHGENFADIVVGLFDKTSSEFKTTFSWNNLAGWQSDLGFQFSNQHLELCHDHGGCPGIADFSDENWDGTEGAALSDKIVDGYKLAHDAPMPLTDTQDLGVFWIMQRDWARGLLELGARYDQRTIETDPVSIDPIYRKAADYYDDKTFNSSSISAALTWRFEKQKLGVSVSRSQRAPSADELYWNGDHHATFSFQLDNADLDVETAHSLDVTWTYDESDYQMQAAVYYYDFDGYIYNDLLSIDGSFHGDPIYRHEQKDAWFSGAEWQLDYEVASNWQWFLRADYVHARLKEGANKNLPRTPPVTSTTGVKYFAGHWQFSSDVKYYAEQNDVAENESPTADYYVFNLYGTYTLVMAESSVEFYAKAHNLTDEFGRNHVSYLKEYSPVVGRNINLGVTYTF